MPDTKSFFQVNQTEGQSGTSLISTQVDPSLPRSDSMYRATDPIIPTEHISQALRAFDPELYDLKTTSHLVRLISAMIGGAGIGGLRKQVTQARINASLAGANFDDLDSFYGILANFNRFLAEEMPTDADGNTFDPYTQTATPDVWDDVNSRDAQFRSRVFQLARAINMGCTEPGIRGIAEAVLSCDVDVFESWKKQDLLSGPTSLAPRVGMTYVQFRSQFPHWGDVDLPYGLVSGGQFGLGISPTGGRGEIVVTPRRRITDEERDQLSSIYRQLAPTGTFVTISASVTSPIATVPIKNAYSDSEDWDIVVRVNPSPSLVQPLEPLYQNSDEYSMARPLFSEFVGERWSYNPNVVKSYSYRIDTSEAIIQGDDEVINFRDGTSHVYKAPDAVMDTRQAISTRLSGDGIVTAFPYVSHRSNKSTV